MTATVFDVDIIELLDFDPDIPCIYNNAILLPQPDPHEPALWLVYWKPILPCCDQQPHRMIEPVCGYHWDRIQSRFNVFCMKCGKQIDLLSKYVDRVETIKK